MITSRKNEQVKAWRKLHKRKGRLDSGTFLIEGYHLLEEARKSGWPIQEIIVREGAELPEWTADFPVEEVSREVFQHLSQTESPQGIAAVAGIQQVSETSGKTVLLIDAVQDPGNLGTMIRTADAAGFSGIILGEGTVDVYNDKVVRATQGSLFHIPIREASLGEAIPDLQRAGFTVWATALEDAKNFQDAGTKEKLAVIVGNEGAGVQEAWLELANERVHIPIYGKAESLNVSIAAGILMYEAAGRLR
ncbi:TrmH family RNA methyltransferase [Lentibacillus sediminis]|uniref:TrmH family RNA methyltransferase n=1 Tax=Lentibacillus sediminis TaxID=1940529 RepID=UPI000C1C63A5|nr:RNA methyltransferase [Lentibacillus sediminis]